MNEDEFNVTMLVLFDLYQGEALTYEYLHTLINRAYTDGLITANECAALWLVLGCLS